MRRTLRDLADARRELLEIQQEFVRLQNRIAVRDRVTDSLTCIFCEERPAIAGWPLSLGNLPAAMKQIGNR